jgi:DNA-binding GntR family transcriptional regulator
MVIDRAGAPLHFVEGARQLEDSLYAALDEAGFRPVRALQRLRAAIVGPAEAALLEVAEGAAALDIRTSPISPAGGVSSSVAPSTVPTRLISSPN